MRWLDRLLARRGGYTSCRISAIEAVDQAVELEGEVEGLSLLRDPIFGEPAVVLEYTARTPGVTQRYFGIHGTEAGLAVGQAVDFVLRDPTGAARIEVESGADVGELHRRLRAEFGIDLDSQVQRVEPGDRVRIRGRVRSLGDQSSPHRREPWSIVVRADEIELA